MNSFRSAALNLVLVCSLIGCDAIKDHRRDFLRRFAQEDFRIFRGLSLFWRGGDADNLMLVVADDRLAASCPARNPFTFVSIDRKSLRVSRIEDGFGADCRRRLTDSQLRQLAAKMVAYQVQSLGADSAGNVFVGIRPNNFRSVDLLKMTDKAALDARYSGADYAPVQGAWYESRSEE